MVDNPHLIRKAGEKEERRSSFYYGHPAPPFRQKRRLVSPPSPLLALVSSSGPSFMPTFAKADHDDERKEEE